MPGAAANLLRPSGIRCEFRWYAQSWAPGCFSFSKPQCVDYENENENQGVRESWAG